MQTHMIIRFLDAAVLLTHQLLEPLSVSEDSDCCSIIQHHCPSESRCKMRDAADIGSYTQQVQVVHGIQLLD